MIRRLYIYFAAGLLGIFTIAALFGWEPPKLWSSDWGAGGGGGGRGGHRSGIIFFGGGK